MRSLNLVLAHSNAYAAENLAENLRAEFRTVAMVQTPAEIRSAVARLRSPAVIVDMELISYAELKELCSDFPATAFIAIHRLADNQTWADTLAMGAADCCVSNDVRSILYATDRNVKPAFARGAAAA